MFDPNRIQEENHPSVEGYGFVLPMERFEFAREVMAWCEEQFGPKRMIRYDSHGWSQIPGVWRQLNRYIIFDRETDAVAFKLRWL